MTSLITLMEDVKSRAEAAQKAMAGLGDAAEEAWDQVIDGADEAADSWEESRAAAEESSYTYAEFAASTRQTMDAFKSGISSTEQIGNAFEKSSVLQTKLEIAQIKYNEALDRYGPTSMQAEQAALRLEAAEQAVQRNRLNMITSIPSYISSMAQLIKSYQAMSMAQKGVLVTGGAIAAVYMALTASSDKMRLAYSALTGVIIAMTVAQWAWNAAKSYALALTGFGLALVGAAAATYAATSAMAKSGTEDLQGSIDGLSANVGAMKPGKQDIYITIPLQINAEKLETSNVRLLAEQLARELKSSLQQEIRNLGYG